MPGFFNKLIGKDVTGRVQDVQYLGNMDSYSSMPKLIKALEDEAVEVRRAAALALGQHSRTGNTASMIALIGAIVDPDAEVRKNAVLSLGDFINASKDAGEADAAKKAMISLLEKESDQEVIKNIALSLGQVQDPALIGPMINAFRLKDKKTISMSINALDDLLVTNTRLEMKKALRTLL
jgi:HEAT repeat protein